MLYSTRAALAVLSLGIALQTAAAAQDSIGLVEEETRIADGEGGLVGSLAPGDRFGASLGSIGDVDQDGIDDLLAGVPGDSLLGPDRGAALLLFLDAAGGVRSAMRVANGSGGLRLKDGDRFGSALAGLPDSDGDGAANFAAGAPGDDSGGAQKGVLWLLEIDAAGGVTVNDKIMSGSPGPLLAPLDFFGSSIAVLGDLDGNGAVDLAVGAPGDDGSSGQGTGTTARVGAVHVLFFDLSGSVQSSVEIGNGYGGFPAALENGDEFGAALVAIGDLDGDGLDELAVGAPGDDDGGMDRGATWVLFLNSDGGVRASTKISATAGSFQGVLEDADRFGCALAATGDLDGDALADLCIGTPGDDDGGRDRGAAWLVFLAADGSVRDEEKISSEYGGFEGMLADGDGFGSSAVAVGDLDANGTVDLAVGTPYGQDTQGEPSGALFDLLLTGGGVTLDNGSGCNPIALFNGDNLPCIGVVWDPFVEFDDGAIPVGGDPIFNFLGISNKDAPFQTLSFGEPCNEILIDVEPPNPIYFLVVTPGQEFSLPIPPDPSLVGLLCYSQGGDVDAAGNIRLTNALDLVIGF